MGRNHTGPAAGDPARPTRRGDATGGSPTAAETLQQYFSRTMRGDMEAVDQYFTESPDYVLLSDDDPELRRILPWAGRQVDREGIKRAYGALLETLEVVDSRPGVMMSSGEHVSVDGVFVYRVRPTGAVVTSPWAVHATVQDGRIVRFHFYEDSYAVARGMGAP